MPNDPRQTLVNYEFGRHASNGCWTGWVADMEIMKNVEKRCMPETYLERYPRNRATNLNTWLYRFGVYSNGLFLELDRYGSALVKDLIKHSETTHGFQMRITGIRKGDKILVKTAEEVKRPVDFVDPDLARASAKALRGEFAKMRL